MSGPIPGGAGNAGGAGAAAAAEPPRDVALREACAQLEGVFMMQLMKALRETVPEGGVLDGGAGEDIFSGLMDGELSALAATRFERGLGAALYRRLSGGAAGAAPVGERPDAG